jgi:hypothetical protein
MPGEIAYSNVNLKKRIDVDSVMSVRLFRECIPVAYQVVCAKGHISIDFARFVYG